jgi:hypothetical protein
VSWDFSVATAGKFTVNITYSCAAPGSAFTVQVGDAKLTGTSQSTGSWSDYTTETLGQLTLDPGKHTLAVKPMANPPWRVIGLKSIELKP